VRWWDGGLDPKVKQKWVKALRSGRYHQGKGALVRRTEGEDRFCPLGVLANITEGFDVVPKKEYEKGKVNGSTTYFGITCGLTYGDQQRIISINDQDGCSLETAADFVEHFL
tara:strand:- start:609 stop:944 length:336 start_codon:yes stop_codon:yes gene_type:complete